MMNKKYLNNEQRNLFSWVKRAIQCNPFSQERAKVDQSISGEIHPKKGNTVDATLPVVRRHVECLEDNECDHLENYNAQDADLLTYLYAYDIFHRFIKNFDEHIIQQDKDRSSILKVPFAKKAIHQLLIKGFPQPIALKFFAFFFQMRRAYYFIEKNLIGISSPIEQLRIKLWNTIFTHDIELYNQYLWNRMEDFPTLVLGETGTGKGNSAMSIGKSGFIPFDESQAQFSENFNHTFVAINLSQFSEALIESELFGHVKGAFTGAVRDKEGIFSRLSPHGAVFLDEIGDISSTLQIKLLKVIEEREFSPVGSKELRRFKGRIIAATNVPPKELLGKKLLREDFYYRLCSDVIEIPTLHERISDTPKELDTLCAMLVERILGTPSKEKNQMVLSILKSRLPENYSWPGNVRELGQCIRQILLNQTIFFKAQNNAPSSDLLDSIFRGMLKVSELNQWYCAHLFEIHENYGKVAGLTGLDRRTVKKYVQSWHQSKS